LGATTIRFTLQVLFAKLTYIFLSWLNSKLESAPFGLVCVLVVIVGFSMFMLPPVPGIPVYIFSGIVISAQALRVEWIGFFGSVLLAVVLSLITKLIACVGQYSIGACLGSSIKIQQLIGVDQVPTRAIEKLLNQRGLRPSKVAILMGGPDWPVSVTCGILRVNIPQMLLGTLPVVVISTPCVMAGSFLTRVTGCSGQEDKWAAYSGYAILASTIAQGGALLLAFYVIPVAPTGRLPQAWRGTRCPSWKTLAGLGFSCS
jgi:membrane protein DedA with SNARE-associated domain